MAGNNKETEAFDLKDFFPYQVRVFYRAVSQSIAEIYSKKHGLSVYEWRAMAVLGNHQPLSAGEVVEYSSLDKVQISRAVKGLSSSGLLERRVDAQDKRRVNLQLTNRGNAIFRELVGLVQVRESEILSDLSNEEIKILKNLMARVRIKADKCFSNSGKINADELS